MADTTAFAPLNDNSFALNVTATDATVTPVAAPQVTSALGGNIRLYNAGPSDLFFAWDVAAVVPTNGSPAKGVPLPAGAVETFTVGGTVLHAICASGNTATLYGTVGMGV